MPEIFWAVLIGLVFALPSVVCAFLAFLIWEIVEELRKDLKTPSGDPIGHVAERTHDLAAVNQAQLVVQGQKLTEAKLDQLHGITDDCYKQVMEAVELLRRREAK